MGGIRKTPLQIERMGPDILALIKKNPLGCEVRYAGRVYRFTTCVHRNCCKEYWHTYFSATKVNSKRTYCSDECSLAEQKLLRNERQERWRLNNPEVYTECHRRYNKKHYDRVRGPARKKERRRSKK